MAKKKNKKKNNKGNAATSSKSASSQNAAGKDPDVKEETSIVAVHEDTANNAAINNKEDADDDVFVGDIDMSGACNENDTPDAANGRHTDISIQVSEAEISAMHMPLLSGSILKSQDLTDKVATDLNDKPVKRHVSFEETSALITTIEDGVKQNKGSKLKSDDPWSSFDTRDGKKSKSVVVIEENSLGIWDWVMERTCCKRRNRAVEL